MMKTARAEGGEVEGHGAAESGAAAGEEDCLGVKKVLLKQVRTSTV